MNKFIIIFIFIILTGATLYAQSDAAEQHRQTSIKKADSVMTLRLLQKMQSLFTLTTRQQQALKEAVVNLNMRKRNVFTQYKGTMELKPQMDSERQLQDSVYRSIVGETNYALYTEALKKEMAQKEAIMAERMKNNFPSLDTINHKRNNK
jgi:hypothetical protein